MHPKDFWQLGGASWFLLGWAAATVLTKYRQHRSALTIRQPRNLDNLLAQLVANLNKVLRQATAIGVRVDVSRLLHSAATTLELLRDVKRGYCGGGAVTQELLLRRRPGATPADRARAITDSPRRRPPLPAAPAAARDDAIAGGHGGYHTPNRGGGRGLTGLPGSPPTELGSPQPQKRRGSPSVIVLEDEGGDGGSGGGGGSTLYERVYAECVANRTPVRKFRPQYCGSSSPEEYVAKLVCIRQACDRILENNVQKIWFRDQLRTILTWLLSTSTSANVPGFQTAYDELCAYVMDDNEAGFHPHTDILPELQNKGILSSSAYDVAIDYILLDAYDDLADPPRAVLAVLRGIPFGRQPLLENAVWGIIQAKSKVNFGPFKARYYELMKQVSPYLASGLLECAVPEFTQSCLVFKELTSDYTRSLFRLVGKQQTLDELVEDVIAMSHVTSRKFHRHMAQHPAGLSAT